MSKEAKSETRSNGGQVFERILDRERELSVKVDEARQQGETKVAEAQGNVLQIARDTQERARIKAKEEVAAIETQTQTQIESLKQQHTKECAVLREDLRRHVPEAVDFVIDLVTGAKAPSDFVSSAGEGGEA